MEWGCDFSGNRQPVSPTSVWNLLQHLRCLLKSSLTHKSRLYSSTTTDQKKLVVSFHFIIVLIMSMQLAYSQVLAKYSNAGHGRVSRSTE